MWEYCNHHESHKLARQKTQQKLATICSRASQQTAPAGMRPLCQRSSAPKAPEPPRGPRPPGGGMGGMFSRDSCLKVSASMPLGVAAGRPGQERCKAGRQ